MSKKNRKDQSIDREGQRLSRLKNDELLQLIKEWYPGHSASLWDLHDNNVLHFV